MYTKETGLLIPFVVTILGTKFLTNLVLVRQNSTQLRTGRLVYSLSNLVYLSGEQTNACKVLLITPMKGLYILTESNFSFTCIGPEQT